MSLLVACGDERPPQQTESSISDSADATMDGTGVPTTVSETMPDKLDVAAGTATDDDGDVGVDSCKKVDLLFVIDSSGSMEDEQSNLIDAFPDFIQTMRDQLADTDGYNLGVVRTDANDISCVAGRYGTLVTRNFAFGSSMSTCDPYASGMRFMTQDDNLNQKFACAARVGTGGDGDERPAQALISALTSPQIDDGDCNGGFLRDDALLIVVIITDEEDDHETAETACAMTPLPGSDGDPSAWFSDVVAVKGGVETNIVVLALVGPTGADACPPLDKCNDGITGAEPAARLIEFTQMFTHGFVGQVCGDYNSFFQEAVATIDSACDDFTPPG